MYSERPSTRRIVWTIVGWGVGFVALAAVVFAIAWALTPKAAVPVKPATEASATPTATPVPTVTPAPPPAVVPTTPPTVVPTATPSLPATPAVNLSNPGKPLAGKVVVIDAGHQRHGDNSLEPIGPGSSVRKPKVTTGATGYKTQQLESATNLAIALKLRDALKGVGATVIMVRTSNNVNIANSKRAKIANDAHADLFVRLHCDSNVKHSMHGLSTLIPAVGRWTKPIAAASERAGGFVHQSTIASSGAKDLGLVKRKDLSGFNYSKVPTVLVEMGFLSNAEEDRSLALPSYQYKLVSGLANGIASYLKSY